jgi:hypothetical protein
MAVTMVLVQGHFNLDRGGGGEERPNQIDDDEHETTVDCLHINKK